MRRAYSEVLGNPRRAKSAVKIFVFGRVDFVNHEKHALAPI